MLPFRGTRQTTGSATPRRPFHPLATGVLVVCVGKATGLAQDIESKEKTYIANLDLGYRTDTLDVTGEILEKREFLPPTKEEFEKV